MKTVQRFGTGNLGWLTLIPDRDVMFQTDLCIETVGGSDRIAIFLSRDEALALAASIVELMSCPPA